MFYIVVVRQDNISLRATVEDDRSDEIGTKLRFHTSLYIQTNDANFP